MKITSIGQATFYIEDGSLTVLTDPWFSTGGLGALLAPRLKPPTLRPDQINSCCLILLSHLHLDHWDVLAAVLARRCDSTIVTNVDAARRLKRKGLTAIGLQPGETWTGSNATVQAVKAIHPLSPHAIGLVLSGPAGKTLFFSGDTRDHPGLDRLSKISLDLAFLQVSCARYPFLGADGMDWQAAAALAGRIKPHLFIPMHFSCRGKYLDVKENLKTNDLAWVEAFLSQRERELNDVGIACRVLRPGETLEI
ncbi:MAG: MBL fold metallo-hydrolase [Bacillota bacterium]|nr:MBL fold metallo-hydrolase [Bacillota bacterium]